MWPSMTRDFPVRAARSQRRTLLSPPPETSIFPPLSASPPPRLPPPAKVGAGGGQELAPWREGDGQHRPGMAVQQPPGAFASAVVKAPGEVAQVERRVIVVLEQHEGLVGVARVQLPDADE